MGTFKVTIRSLDSGAPFGLIVNDRKLPWVSPYGLRTIEATLDCLGMVCREAGHTAVRSGRTLSIIAHCGSVYAGDGFDGEIFVALNNAPAGFALHGARIPAGWGIVIRRESPPSAVSR